MTKIVSGIYLLNNDFNMINIFENALILSAAIINNAEPHLNGYLVNSSLLDILYHHKVLTLIKEDSEELDALESVIKLIESRPFTTFLYKERVLNGWT